MPIQVDVTLSKHVTVYHVVYPRLFKKKYNMQNEDATVAIAFFFLPPC